MTDRSDGGMLGLTAAAERLGVHYQTAYKWVRDGTLPAVRLGRTYSVDPADVDGLLQRRATPSAPPKRRPDVGRAAGRMHRFLVDGDEPRARSMVRELTDQGVRASEIAEGLVAPALFHIGESWHRGEVSVAVEHRASAIAGRVLADIMPNPRGRRRGTAVVACLPGDQHGLASVMATIALREDHWNVEHLGADVPLDELQRFACDVDADLVVLTVTLADEHAATTVADELRRAGRNVLVGRPGATLEELLQQAREQNLTQSG